MWWTKQNVIHSILRIQAQSILNTLPTACSTFEAMEIYFMHLITISATNGRMVSLFSLHSTILVWHFMSYFIHLYCSGWVEAPKWSTIYEYNVALSIFIHCIANILFWHLNSWNYIIYMEVFFFSSHWGNYYQLVVFVCVSCISFYDMSRVIIHYTLRFIKLIYQCDSRGIVGTPKLRPFWCLSSWTK